MTLPGDLNEQQMIARMIRVNQAGEYGAKRIYAGQLAMLHGKASEETVRHMAEQEQKHLDYFNEAVRAQHVRPTIFQPLWHVGGWMLGAVSAALGEKAAMACTVAVESVIDAHYARQSEWLEKNSIAPELKAQIDQFRAEEMEHHDTALEYGAQESPVYPLLTAVIRTKTKLAIWLSERF